MIESHSNPLFRNLREVAGKLRKPQAVVAANWMAAGLYAGRYSETRYLGVTRVEYRQFQTVVRRLAGIAR